MYITRQEYYKNEPSSGVLFVFWFTMLLSSSIACYSRVLHAVYAVSWLQTWLIVPWGCGCAQMYKFQTQLGGDILITEVMITLQWMSEDRVDDKTILVQVMAWCSLALSHGHVSPGVLIWPTVRHYPPKLTPIYGSLPFQQPSIQPYK